MLFFITVLRWDLVFHPKTLTEDNMVEGCLGDLRELAPTAFAGVPLVYDRIKAGIMKKVAEESIVKQLIFKFALAVKQYAWKHGKATPLLIRLFLTNSRV